MKRILSTLVLFLSSFSFLSFFLSSDSFVQELPWTPVNTVKLMAQTKEEVFQVLSEGQYGQFKQEMNWLKENELTKIIAGFPINPIKTLRIDFNVYKWNRSHSCRDENDPRLSMTLSSGNITYRNRASTNWTSAFPVPEEGWDPCAENAQRPEVKKMFSNKVP